MKQPSEFTKQAHQQQTVQQNPSHSRTFHSRAQNETKSRDPSRTFNVCARKGKLQGNTFRGCAQVPTAPSCECGRSFFTKEKCVDNKLFGISHFSVASVWVGTSPCCTIQTKYDCARVAHQFRFVSFSSPDRFNSSLLGNAASHTKAAAPSFHNPASDSSLQYAYWKSTLSARRCVKKGQRDN